MASSIASRAWRKPDHQSTSWRRPTATKSHDGVVGQPLRGCRPPLLSPLGSPSRTCVELSTMVPLILAAGLIRVSLAAALYTDEPSDFVASVGSMPCQKRGRG